LTRHVLPRRLSFVFAERDAPVGRRFGQADAPAVLREPDEVVMRPAFLTDGDSCAEEDLVLLERDGAEIAPPVDELGLPALERALQAPVFGQADVVRDLIAV